MLTLRTYTSTLNELLFDKNWTKDAKGDALMHKHNQRWIHRSTLITAMSLALAILATPASAAEVKIYGRTDAGFLVQHLKGGDTTYELKSGGRSTPRIGINAVEKLPNGWEAKVYLENDTFFQADTGSR